MRAKRRKGMHRILSVFKLLAYIVFVTNKMFTSRRCVLIFERFTTQEY